VALLVAALIGLRKKSGLSTFQRQALGIAALSFTMSEILLNRVIFASEHNWFHR
jgi:hypothetical protein